MALAHGPRGPDPQLPSPGAGPGAGRGQGQAIFFAHGDVRDLFNPSSESRWKNIRWIYQGLERLLIGSMSRVFVVNREGCEYYRRRYPKIRDRFTFMPAAFDPRVFFVRKDLDRKGVLARHGIRDRSSIVLFVGRLEEQKAPFLLLDSFRPGPSGSPRRRSPDRRTGTAGGGPEKEGAGAFPGGKHLLAGPQSGSEVSELMNVSTIFFLTSAFEGMPRVVMEALACGLPVVSTDAGDVSLVVRDGVNGRIVASRDPEAIARAAVERPESPAAIRPVAAPRFGLHLGQGAPKGFRRAGGDPG